MLVRGAHGAFSDLTTKSTVKASSNFYHDQEKPGMYVSEFKGPCSGFVHKAETRIRIRLSIRVRIPELLQARTYAIPYVKEPAGQRDVYGQSGCCPVRFRNTCMFGIAHAARFQHE